MNASMSQHFIFGQVEDTDDTGRPLCSKSHSRAVLMRAKLRARLCLVPGEAFVETDKRYLQADTGANRDDGCTAVTAVLMDHTVVVAHVGDSRAVLSRGGKGVHFCLLGTNI